MREVLPRIMELREVFPSLSESSRFPTAYLMELEQEADFEVSISFRE